MRIKKESTKNVDTLFNDQYKIIYNISDKFNVKLRCYILKLHMSFNEVHNKFFVAPTQINTISQPTNIKYSVGLYPY
jgi:hypothetical protein